MGKVAQALRRAERQRGGRLPVVGPCREEVDGHLVALLDRASPASEQYRTLCTNLRGLSAEHPPRTLVVTSAIPREGKSVTALNLAVTLADTSDCRVALVDADLRKPTLHRLLGMDNQRGLSDYLAGNLLLELVLQRTRVANLVLLPAGRLPANPTELLAGKRMLDLLERLSRDYDYVVVDTPPVVSITDAAVVAPMVDGALLVVRMGGARRDAVKQAVDLLKKARVAVLGTVLTHASTAMGDYHYYPYE